MAEGNANLGRFMIRIIRGLVALVASAGVFAATPVYPALAAEPSIYGCNDGFACFYDGTNFGTYWWQMLPFTAPYSYTGHCINTDDFGMNNNVSSIILNPNPSQKSSYGALKVRFHMNANCTGTPTAVYSVTETTVVNLTDTEWGNISNAITSWSLKS